MNEKPDNWNNGDPYEYFMGRWSKLMAVEFITWLTPGKNLSWLDVGCGTGALGEAVFRHCNPGYLCLVDPSQEFLLKAKSKGTFEADFVKGSASELPFSDNTFDFIVSGLALNFFPDVPAALTEMKRVLKADGSIAAYLWDYAGKMEFLRFFWDAAGEIDVNAKNFDEGIRFPVCNADNLRTEFQNAGLKDIETTSLDIATVFKDFEDFWNPFLGNQGPAPGYLSSLNKEKQDQLRSLLFKRLNAGSGNAINLTARAIAVQGKIQ